MKFLIKTTIRLSLVGICLLLLYLLWRDGDISKAEDWFYRYRTETYLFIDRTFKRPDAPYVFSDQYEAMKSPYDNLTQGVPCCTGAMVDRRGFAIGYDRDSGQPRWVSYKMTADEVNAAAVPRTDDFREDPYLHTASSFPDDYEKSGYDRGHMAAAADMGYSSRTMSESFYMSNMSPQFPEFNRGIWKDLEFLVRRWAAQYGELYVITGPVLRQNEHRHTIEGTGIVIPEMFFKVIYVPEGGTAAEPRQAKMIGFMLPNSQQKNTRQLYEFAVPVSKVEQCTGLNFFNLLPEKTQRYLENKCDVNEWKWQFEPEAGGYQRN